MADGADNWAREGSQYQYSMAQTIIGGPFCLDLAHILYFLLFSFPDCFDFESRCSFDWLCFLLEIQFTSITGRFLPWSSFQAFHNKQMATMQCVRVPICFLFLLDCL